MLFFYSFPSRNLSPHAALRRRAVALCTLVKARGSTPQEAGAKMAVTRDGTLHGTLGGGCVEAEVRRRAVEFLHLGRSELLTFRLDHDYAGTMG